MVGSDRLIMSAIGGARPEGTFAFGSDASAFHQTRDTVFADAPALMAQLMGNAGAAITLIALTVNVSDGAHQSPIGPGSGTIEATAPLVIAAAGQTEHRTKLLDWIVNAQLFHEGKSFC